MSMRLRRRSFAKAAIMASVAIAFAAPLAAHHSTALFEWGTAKPLKGATVERWVWTNPHTFLYVKAGGQQWAFEGMSPNHLARHGWSKRSLAPGETIDLTYYPLRDGRRGGFNVTVTKSDGTVLQQLPTRDGSD